MPNRSTGQPTIPATPGGIGTQFGRLNRISTKPKARSPKASTMSRTDDRLAAGAVDDGAKHRGGADVLDGVVEARARRRARPRGRADRARGTILLHGFPTWGGRRRSQGSVPEARRGLLEVGPDPDGRRRGAARPVRSSVSTANPLKAPSPEAGSSREPGVFWRKRRIGSSLLHAEHGIVVAAHAGVGDVGGAAGQDAVVGGRHVRVGADDEGRPAVEVVAERLLLARRLGVDVDHDGVGDLAARGIGAISRSAAAKGSSSGVHEDAAEQVDDQDAVALGASRSGRRRAPACRAGSWRGGSAAAGAR